MIAESINDALIEVVKVCGGSKVVGAMLRPEMLADDAGRWLRDCLNADRREVLSPERLLFILRLGRERGCHFAMEFISSGSGYAPPQPIEPEDHRAKLMRDFIEAQRGMQRIATQMERAGVLKAAA